MVAVAVVVGGQLRGCTEKTRSSTHQSSLLLVHNRRSIGVQARVGTLVWRSNTVVVCGPAVLWAEGWPNMVCVASAFVAWVEWFVYVSMLAALCICAGSSVTLISSAQTGQHSDQLTGLLTV